MGKPHLWDRARSGLRSGEVRRGQAGPGKANTRSFAEASERKSHLSRKLPACRYLQPHVKLVSEFFGADLHACTKPCRPHKPRVRIHPIRAACVPLPDWKHTVAFHPTPCPRYAHAMGEACKHSLVDKLRRAAPVELRGVRHGRQRWRA